MTRGHLSASYTVEAMQPGNPSSSSLGSFEIHLHPPGSEGYAEHQAVYHQLDYGQRIEMYVSHDAASLGKLSFAGIITGIDKEDGENSHFTLTGVSDLGLANLSRPFPGELLSVGYGSGSYVNGSYRQARNYFGTNEPGWMDAFNPYSAGNYTSLAVRVSGGETAGAWSATTDAGQPVVSCSTGTGAGLLSKFGARAGDTLNTQFAEISGRLLPSTDAGNSGEMGVGLSLSNASAQASGASANSLVAFVRAKWNAGPGTYDLDFFILVEGALWTFTNALTNVADPEGYIPLTISVQTRGGSLNGDAQVVIGTVNGRTFYSGQIFDFGQPTVYPFLFFGAASSGTATAYVQTMVQEVRYTDDRNPGLAVFKSGTIGSPAHSLPVSSDAGPTFLEVWSRAAAAEGWYWRYTPQPFVAGVRTLGTVDFTNDPGTDFGTTQKVVFNRLAGNLLGLQLSANAEQFTSGTAASGVSGTDGGGVAYWRDISTMTKYGVIDDQTLAVTAANFSEQRRAAQQIVSNKIALGPAGSKSALVLRDPQTADTFRELDKVMIHNPEMGINYLVMRILAYTFDENSPHQALILDQYGAEFPQRRGIIPGGDPAPLPGGVPAPSPPIKRLQQAIFQVANKFGNR